MTIDPTAGQHLAALNTALATVPLGVQSILATATSTLSRLMPATWMAVVMNPNPETSRVVVADDADPTMAEYVDTYIAAIDRPNRAPTVGLSQQVIESGNPVFRKGLALDELRSMVSSAGQAFVRINPPPGGRRDVDFLMVPMRVGGATVGTLAVADWNHREVVTESDIEWVQAAADRVALSIELSRLAGAARDDAVRLDLVRSIGLAFRQRQDVGLVTRVVVEQITSRLDVDAADILLLAEGAHEMVLQATAGFRSAMPVGNRVQLGSLGLDGDWEPRVDHLADVDRACRRSRSSPDPTPPSTGCWVFSSSTTGRWWSGIRAGSTSTTRSACLSGLQSTTRPLHRPRWRRIGQEGHRGRTSATWSSTYCASSSKD